MERQPSQRAPSPYDRREACARQPIQATPRSRAARRDTEKRKREEPISTDAFHELANEVNKVSNEVFRLAREQDEIGEEIPTGTERRKARRPGR